MCGVSLQIEMLAFFLVIIVLPAIVFSSISINIKQGGGNESPSVEFSGEDLQPLSDKDREYFKLSDEILKNATELHFGRRCSDVYIKPPTPYGNVWQKYGWNLPKRYLYPDEARVIGIQTKPVAVATVEYVNDHPAVDVTYTTSITQQVEETVSHTWSIGGESSTELNINYNIDFKLASVGGSLTKTYTSTWGHDTTDTTTVTLGSTSGLLVTISPNSSATATLTATKGSLKVEVEYGGSIALKGDLFCNYDPPYKGHHFYAFPLKVLLRSTGHTWYFYTTEEISVGFYTDAKIQVSESKRMS